jgi:hypothetical protein
MTPEKMMRLVRWRFGCVMMNPIRTWSVDGKVYHFKRGSNQPKGLHMSNLGAFVRHVFYDKKTQIIYSLDGPLSRKLPLVEEPDFMNVLMFEWQKNVFYAQDLPHSLEYMAKIYKCLIQNIIEPDLDVDTLKEYIRGVILSTFNRLTVGTSHQAVDLEADRRKLLAKRDEEYRSFGHELMVLAEEYKNVKPRRAVVVTDHSDYGVEEEFNDPERRAKAIRAILSA